MRNPPVRIHTSNTVATHTSHQAINPVRVLLRLADDHGVTFLKDLVYRDQGLERLDLIGEDRLPRMDTDMSATCAVNTIACLQDVPDTYTFMPAQKAADDLWSQV